jgi:hypothetical protein
VNAYTTEKLMNTVVQDRGLEQLLYDVGEVARATRIGRTPSEASSRPRVGDRVLVSRKALVEAFLEERASAAA